MAVKIVNAPEILQALHEAMSGYSKPRISYNRRLKCWEVTDASGEWMFRAQSLSACVNACYGNTLIE